MKVLVVSRLHALRVKTRSDLCISIRSSDAPRGVHDVLTGQLAKVSDVVLPIYCDDYIPTVRVVLPSHVSKVQFSRDHPIYCDDYIPTVRVVLPSHVSKVPFSRDHATSIIEAVKGVSTVLAHCDAGVCRSVAVGAFLRDFYDAAVTFHETCSDQYMNRHIYNTLVVAYNEEPYMGLP